MQTLLIEAILLAICAGQNIMRFYKSENAYWIKDDLSPLTQADLASNQIIIEGLRKQSHFPICTEESPISVIQRQKGEFYWLVDPLDGTKDFLARNHHFTVNIALMESFRDIPVFGIIYAPALRRLYCGGEEFGVFHLKSNHLLRFLEQPVWSNLKIPNLFYKKEKNLIGCSSVFHHTQESEFFFHHFNLSKRAIGSSLKFCALALGIADIYPRFNGSKEWDIAAGDAILRGSGGGIIDFKTQERICYGKDDFKNNFFIAFSPLIFGKRDFFQNISFDFLLSEESC